MLKQISCDKFMKNNTVRAPIIFHEGLNAILGDELETLLVSLPF